MREVPAQPGSGEGYVWVEKTVEKLVFRSNIKKVGEKEAIAFAVFVPVENIISFRLIKDVMSGALGKIPNLLYEVTYRVKEKKASGPPEEFVEEEYW